MKRIALVGISFYRRRLSHTLLKHRKCPRTPTCSTLAHQAFQELPLVEAMQVVARRFTDCANTNGYTDKPRIRDPLPPAKEVLEHPPTLSVRQVLPMFWRLSVTKWGPRTLRTAVR